MTSVGRNKSESTGRISNIRFVNISAVCENSAWVGARLDQGGQLVTGVVFENVSVTVDKVSNYTCGWMDWRPCSQPDIVPWFIDVFYLENTSNVSYSDVDAAFASPRKLDWGTCYNEKNATDVVQTNFHCRE